MSIFNATQNNSVEFPIINLDAENEHFELCDSVISWIEINKTIIHDQINPEPFQSAANEATKTLRNRMPPDPASYHPLSAPGMAWNLMKTFSEKQGSSLPDTHKQTETNCANIDKSNQDPSKNQQQSNPENNLLEPAETSKSIPNSRSASQLLEIESGNPDGVDSSVRMRGNDEWAPPRAQIIFNIHEDTNLRRLMQRQNYRCAGCGTKIDEELARRLVLYCYYLGKYFCKCCFSHKAVNLPGFILQKWDFHKYPVSHFALGLLNRIANEPLFNINDINPSLYRKVRKLKHLIELRSQLNLMKVYVSSCVQADQLNVEYNSLQAHLVQEDVHIYSLNNLIEIQHGKLYEYLKDLIARSLAHISQCESCKSNGTEVNGEEAIECNHSNTNSTG